MRETQPDLQFLTQMGLMPDATTQLEKCGLVFIMSKKFVSLVKKCSKDFLSF